MPNSGQAGVYPSDYDIVSKQDTAKVGDIVGILNPFTERKRMTEFDNKITAQPFGCTAIRCIKNFVMEARLSDSISFLYRLIRQPQRGFFRLPRAPGRNKPSAYRKRPGSGRGCQPRYCWSCYSTGHLPIRGIQTR